MNVKEQLYKECLNLIKNTDNIEIINTGWYKEGEGIEFKSGRHNDNTYLLDNYESGKYICLHSVLLKVGRSVEIKSFNEFKKQMVIIENETR